MKFGGWVLGGMSLLGLMAVLFPVIAPFVDNGRRDAYQRVLSFHTAGHAPQRQKQLPFLYLTWFPKGDPRHADESMIYADKMVMGRRVLWNYAIQGWGGETQNMAAFQALRQTPALPKGLQNPEDVGYSDLLIVSQDVQGQWSTWYYDRRHLPDFQSGALEVQNVCFADAGKVVLLISAALPRPGGLMAIRRVFFLFVVLAAWFWYNGWEAAKRISVILFCCYRFGDSLMDRSEFLRIVKQQFPNLREQINKEQGLFHFEMAVFRRHTQKAIFDGDRHALKNCFKIAEQAYFEGNQHLKIAIDTSFVEDLDFVTPHNRYDWAWDMLPEKLKSLYKAFHSGILHQFNTTNDRLL